LKNRWIYPKVENKLNIKEIPEVVQAILSNRGYTTKEEMEEFLSCDINSLLDTSLMKDADKGCGFDNFSNKQQ